MGVYEPKLLYSLSHRKSPIERIYVMIDTSIVLSGIWVAVMLTYLLGDVLRMFSGDMEPGKLQGGVQAT